MSDHFEVNGDVVAQELETKMRMREQIEHAAETFTEHLIENAKHHVVVDEFDTNAIVEGIQLLEMDGHLVGTEHTDESEVTAACTPKMQAEIRSDMNSMVRVNTSDSVGSPDLSVHSANINADPTLPDNTALLIHPDAVAPTQPYTGTVSQFEASNVFSIPEPWVLKEPTAMVVIEVQDE